MNKYKLAACIAMILAAAMLFLPFYSIKLPSYFEEEDYTASGGELVKKGMELTDSKMKNKVKSLRKIIKGSDELEDIYDALGEVEKLVSASKAYVLAGLCLPCILLLLGALAGFIMKEGQKGAFLVPCALNAAALAIQGILGVLSLYVFGHYKDELVDGIKDMKKISSGINFLDTKLDTASDVVSKNIDKIELSIQYGWYLFVGLALVALVLLAVSAKQKSTQTTGMVDGKDLPNQNTYLYTPEVDFSDLFDDNPVPNGFNQQGQGLNGQNALNQAPVGGSQQAQGKGRDVATVGIDAMIPEDVNSYGLPRVDPANPSGSLRGLEGSYKEARIPMGNDRLIMGRDPSVSSIVFSPDSEKASRRHCEVMYHAAQKKYQVTDFSKNGVFCYLYNAGRYSGKKRLPKDQAQLLPAGTIIELGDKKNRFRLE